MRPVKKVKVFILLEDVIAMLKSRQGGMPQVEFAKKIGISEQLLSGVYKGSRLPGTDILSFLGLEKVVVYRESPVKGKV